MSSLAKEPIDQLRLRGWVLPLLLALVVHSGLFRAGLTLDEPRIISQLNETSSLSPQELFIDHYIQPRRVDSGYRPLAFATLIAAQDLLGGTWAQRAINICLHAGIALGVWMLLLQLTRNALAATAAACVFAVLPVHTDAVARLLGRAELLTALGGIWAWVIALVNVNRPGAERESIGLATVVGGLMLGASFAHESTVVLLPVVMVLGSLLLRQRVPWISASAALAAVLGSFAVRSLALEGRAGLASPLHQPLANASILERLFHAPSLATLHTIQTLLPFRLTAERTVLDAPATGLAVTSIACVAWLIVLGLIVVAALKTTRWRLTAVGLLTFCLLIAPAALMISPLKRPGVESAAYLPSVGWVILLAGGALYLLARTRSTVLVLATAILCVSLGARTVWRNEDWVSGDVARLVPTRASPDWGRRLFEAHGDLEDKTPLHGHRELKSFLEVEATRLAIASPGNGWTEALQGNVLFHKGQFAEAIGMLGQAESILNGQSPPQSSARLHQLRGEAYLPLDQAEKGFADLDRYVRMVESSGRIPDARTLSRRGLCHAKLGRLDAAMVDFDRALAIRKDVAEIWNNRGFLRYKLDDLKGAVDDYREGYTACVKANVTTSNQGDSAQAFLLRISDVYQEWGQRLHAEGRAEDGRLALEEAQKFFANAQQLGPAPATMSGKK